MKRLVEQTLGDMADQIEESGFAIRYQCEAVHTRFIGDSSRMYRVVQNVIENALKYSLPDIGQLLTVFIIRRFL